MLYCTVYCLTVLCVWYGNKMDDYTYSLYGLCLSYIGSLLLLICNFRRRRSARNKKFISLLLVQRNRTLRQQRSNRPGLRTTRRLWMKKRTGNYYNEIMTHYTDSEWITNFRMRKCDFMNLVDDIKDDIKPSENCVRKPICTHKRAAIALYKLASAAEYRTVGHLFGVSDPSVYNCLRLFCNAICSKLGNYIKFPSEEEAICIAQNFETKWHFPQAYGCIDGTHIHVTAPAIGKRDYINRKGWESLVLQAVVDDKYRFRDISIKMPGIVHDATVFKESGLYKDRNNLPKHTVKIEDVDVPLLILGDPAYPLMPWLIKTYTGSNQSLEHQNFNYYHTCVRITVENAFNHLKERWRILNKKMDTKVKFSFKIIATCCALHNICEDRNLPIAQAHTAQSRGQNLRQPNMRPSEETSDEGSRIREAICSYLWKNFPHRTSMR